MTSRTLRTVVVGALASGALATGLLSGIPTALAAPDDEQTTETPAPAAAAGPPTPCTGDECHKNDPETKPMTAEEALNIIYTEYDTGAGGGQLSNLVHDVMRLRAQGFRPSKGNVAAIQEALAKRPNQAPLVEALKATLDYQLKQQMQANNKVAQPNQPVLGVGQLPPGVGSSLPPGVPPDQNNGVFVGVPGIGVNQPVG